MVLPVLILAIDQLIVMSVVPGKSGQKYIEETHAKDDQD